MARNISKGFSFKNGKTENKLRLFLYITVISQSAQLKQF
nr:MAG TPA: hypothetical protein [Caudoviricetes sp.]